MVIGLKKKGDVTITTMILIVLGLAVLVMLIVGFTKGWDFFFGKFDQAPSELQTIAKACALYAQGGLSIDFCNYRVVGDEIVNCQDNRIKATLDADGVRSLVCSPLNSNLATLCVTLSESKKGSIKVNQFDSCVSLPESKPVTPTDLALDGNALSNQVKLKWDDKSDNEQVFEIQRKGSSGSYVIITSSISAGSKTYIDTGVTPNTQYIYQIRSRNAAGSSDWSAEFSTKTA